MVGYVIIISNEMNTCTCARVITSTFMGLFLLGCKAAIHCPIKTAINSATKRATKRGWQGPFKQPYQRPYQGALPRDGATILALQGEPQVHCPAQGRAHFSGISHQLRPLPSNHSVQTRRNEALRAKTRPLVDSKGVAIQKNLPRKRGRTFLFFFGCKT